MESQSASLASPSTSRNTISPYTLPEISQLLNATTPSTGLKQTIIPRFERLASQSNQDGAESILCHSNFPVESFSNDQLAIQTVPLIYILTARLENNNQHRHSDRALLALCYRYAKVMDREQAGYIPSRVSRLSWAVLALAKLCDDVDNGLDALYIFSRTSPQHCITGSIAAYLEGCLLVRSYQGAIPCIREVYTDVKTGDCNYLDIITFYHHAGLIAAAIQDFALASELFSIVVSVPTTTVSAIQVAAGKRAMLCELLSTGKRLRLPKPTSQVVARAIEKVHGNYFRLCKAFEDQDWDAVEQAAEKEREAFAKDCNAGLADQVVGAVMERKILKIKTLYTRLTVDQLAARVATSRPKTTEAVVDKLKDMITAGRVQAIISDSSPTIITFSDDAPAAPLLAIKELKNLNGMASVLQQQLERSSREMGLNKKYLQKQAEILEVSNGRAEGHRGVDSNPMFPGAPSGQDIFM